MSKQSHESRTSQAFLALAANDGGGSQQGSSNAGNLLLPLAAGVCAAAAFAYEALPHESEAAAEYLVSLLRHHTDGQPTPVSPQMAALAAAAAADAGVDPAAVRPFVCLTPKGSEAVALGRLSRPSAGEGAPATGSVRLGYPQHLHFTDPAQVDLSRLRIQRSSFDRAGEEMELKARISSSAEELQRSFVLSEKAKKFLLAREIFHALENPVPLHAGRDAWVVLSAYYVLRHLLPVVGGGKSKPLRGVAFAAVVVLAFGFLNEIMRDVSTHGLAVKCDALACALGREYAEGGVELYDKSASKRKATLVLYPDMAGTFTAQGEIPAGLFRSPVPTLRERRAACEKALKEYTEKEQKT